MAEPFISDAFWDQIKPLLPEHPPDPRGGAPRKPDRDCLEGIVHVLRTGCQWNLLPACAQWPSGVTCWRRFTEWTEAGVWPQLHRVLLNQLGKAGVVNLNYVVVDSASVRAKKGARTPDPTQSIEAKRAANATSSPMCKVFRC
jgi:transposase